MALGKIAETKINSREIIVDWLINDFFSLNGHYASEYFKFRERQWLFKMSIGNGGEVLLCLGKDYGPPIIVTLTFGIRGLNGVEMEKGTVHAYSGGGSGSYFPDFCSKLDLRRNPRLVQGDKVVFSCSIKTNDAKNVRDVCTQTCSPYEALAEVKESSEKRGGEKALEDFGKLLESGEKSDVTVQAGDVEFKVHSAILFARSPALSVSLHHESKEKAAKKITIEDCRPDVLRDFLHYIYTGSVQSLTPQNVFCLHRVADKYLADDLKFQCLKHIQDTLCVQTFCDTIKLALAHEENGLLEQALHFATENIQSIICSVEWQDYNCEYPRQANEILIKCLGPRS